ncbi:MAG: HAD family hydrolase [Prevotella sp.]|nr:HAD family hydrolase [Prevotella sp.]
MSALIFDFGGTLDTGGCHWGRFFWHAYQKLNVTLTWHQFAEAYVYAERSLARQRIIMPDFSFRRTLQTKINLQMQWLAQKGLVGSEDRQSNMLSPDTLLDFLYNKVSEYTFESKGGLDVLARHFPLALVTNFYGNMDVVLREFQLEEYFCHVVESMKVGVRKPDPAIFRMGVEALGVEPSRVLVVGDSIDKDIIPAKQVGCKTVWLKGETWDGTTPQDVCADYVVSHISGLKELLKL